MIYIIIKTTQYQSGTYNLCHYQGKHKHLLTFTTRLADSQFQYN